MLVAGAIVATILAAVLLVPVTVELQGEGSTATGAAALRLRLRWLGLARNFDLTRRSARGPGRRAHGDTKPHRQRNSRRRLAAALRPAFLRHALRLCRRLMRLAAPDTVSIQARVGFDDPSATGMLCACAPVVALTRAGRFVRIDPDFTQEVLALQGCARWSRSLGRLAWPILLFLASPPVWSVIVGRRRR